MPDGEGPGGGTDLMLVPASYASARRLKSPPVNDLRVLAVG